MKKRLLSVAVALALAMSLIPAFVAHADDDVRVTIDGQDVAFPDQRPVIIGGRTLVPVRGVFEGLGFEVGWDDDTRAAVLVRHDFTVIIPIGSYAFTVNGRAYNLDVPAQIIGGRTMLPLRLPLESVGYAVDWDAAARTVVILTAPIQPMGQNAEITEVHSGEAGDNITWTLDTSTGVLTLSGTGAMWDWAWIWSSDVPWVAYVRSITSVVIADGITCIGDGAFLWASSLSSIYMPSVTRVGDGAFAGAISLASIYMPSVTHIGDGAFVGASSLASATIHSRDATFGVYVFYDTHQDFTIHAFLGSTAHDYAIRNGHNFVPLD